jgi:hypothetical protein
MGGITIRFFNSKFPIRKGLKRFLNRVIEEPPEEDKKGLTELFQKWYTILY